MLITGTTAAAPAGEVILHKGDAMPSFGAADINDPAPRFMRVYSNEMFSLMGATSISYSSRDYNQINLRFQDYAFAKVADAILKDTVLGARLVMTDSAGTPYDMTRPAPDWTRNPSNLARQVSALPGVTSYKWLGQSLLFATDSTDTRVKLQQLVDRKLDGVTMAYWKGECFGKGCKPDPAPPTGEM